MKVSLSKKLLSINLAGLQLSSPTALASGILGYSTASLHNVARNGAGAVVTKSIGIVPRVGYVNPTVVQVEGGLLNAIGLPNPGIDAYVKEINYAKEVLKVPLVVSIYGYTADEYAIAAQKATEAGADAIELNVSCPHVKDTGSEIGQHPQILKDVICKVKATIKKPVIVKLSPNVSDIADIADAAAKAGADALTAINTVKAMAIDVETQIPVLSNIRGGLSGPAIKPIALRSVYDIYERVKVPIFGCGGITSWKDAVEFLLAGASAVQIGTGIAYEDQCIFQNINDGVEAYLKKKKLDGVKDLVGVAHRA